MFFDCNVAKLFGYLLIVYLFMFQVEASRRTSIEELPLVLIFHLKYFVFDRKGGCQKIHKALDIPVNLEIPKGKIQMYWEKCVVSQRPSF